jgi:myo-inositol catabolism protein IolC
MAGTPGWRPSHDDPLFIMAMDHRASFGKTLFDVQDDHPDAAQLAAMRSAKQLIYEGLMQAVPGLSSGRAGVLVDEQYGQQVIDEAATDSARVVLAVPAFVGFAIGRSIWEDVVREYEASDRGDSAADDARGTIAGRYLRFVARWTA